MLAREQGHQGIAVTEDCAAYLYYHTLRRPDHETEVLQSDQFKPCLANPVRQSRPSVRWRPSATSVRREPTGDCDLTIVAY
jgi:hypothetical protein